MSITIASCQFPVCADITKNATYICRQIRQASERGADVIHFCEGALSGYVGHDFDSFANFNWPRLKECTHLIMEQAKRSHVHVVLGSSHPLSKNHRPHNSLYVINRRGMIVTRYDKRFCASDESGEGGELDHFTPGDHATVFAVNGVKCGVLICHEYRYPELYRQLKNNKVDVVFHSFHAANVKAKRLEDMRMEVGAKYHHLNRGDTYPAITMPAAIQTAAQCNFLWISATNSSAPESLWASFMVRPDGVTIGRLRKNTTGILLSCVDTKAKFYDATKAWRTRAMNGRFHSGTLISDPRSKNLKDL